MIAGRLLLAALILLPSGAVAAATVGYTTVASRYLLNCYAATAADLPASPAEGAQCFVDDADETKQYSDGAWISMGGGGGGAPTGAEYVVSASHGSLSAERVGTDTATIDFDAGTAAQAKWNFLPAGAEAGLEAVLDVDDLQGNLGVAHLNSGTSASSSTYWRGDGTWATPSGGGGSSEYDPKVLPASFGTGGWGEEFSGGTNTNLTSNLNSASSTLELDGLSMTLAANGADNLRGYCGAVPASGDWTFHVLGSGKNDATYNQWGAGALQGTVASPTRIDFVTMLSITNTSLYFSSDQWSNATSHVTAHATTQQFDEPTNYSLETYYRVDFTDSSNAMTFSYSRDGRLYPDVGVGINVGGNPGFVCIGGSSTNGSVALPLHYQFARLRTDAGRAYPSD